MLLDSAGIDISTDPRGQSNPSCASDGHNFMVSYNTQRCDTGFTDIYAARINSDGIVLDTNGFAVCTEAHDQIRSKIAYGNGGFLVIWQDLRNFDSTGYDIYGIRVASDGTTSDSSGKRITHQRHWEVGPSVVWGGESYLTVWEAENNDQFRDISGIRLDTLGNVLDSSSLVISTACDAQFSGSSAWSGSSYLAIWEENHDMYGARIDRFGNLLDSAMIRISSAPEDQEAPSLTWGDGKFLAVWEDFRYLNFDIYGARIDSSGKVLDTLGLPIEVDSTSDQRHPEISFDGRNFLVVWQKALDSTGANYRIEGKRISSEGETIDPQPFSISSGDKGAIRMWLMQEGDIW